MNTFTVDDWVDVPGFNGRMQANIEGRLRKIYKSGIIREISRYVSKKKRGNVVCRCKFDGKEYTAARLVYEAFYGPIPDGLAVVHKNRLHSDTNPQNLVLMSKKELGDNFCIPYNSRPVARINKDGEIDKWFRSARSAGKEEFLSRQTITDRCNHRVKYLMSCNGYAYEWGDDLDKIDSTIEEIKRCNQLNISLEKANSPFYRPIKRTRRK